MIYLKKIFKLLCEKWIDTGQGNQLGCCFSSLSEVMMIMIRKEKL